jgi:hypothetical protein
MVRVIELDGWLRVMIEVGEDATFESLRKALPLSLRWRGQLLAYQGPWMRGGDNRLLQRLHEMQQSGESYSELADQVNRKVSELLEEWTRHRAEYKLAKQQIKDPLDWITWHPSTDPFALERARTFLSALSLKHREIEVQLQAGLERIEGGLAPFEKDYPISREKMISVLRTWRLGKKHESIKAPK